MYPKKNISILDDIMPYEYQEPGYLTPADLEKPWYRFMSTLFRNVQDGHWNNEARQKAINLQNHKRNDYVYTIGHGKAIGSISRTAEKQLFQGSSYNRKQKPASEPEAIPQTEKEYFEQITQSEFRAKFKLLRHVKKLHTQRNLDGKKISRRSRDKIREKMLAMFNACKGKNGYRAERVDFTMVTLTFIGRVTDRKATHVLGAFLDVVQRKYRQFNYIWVAEKQENGNIHFHLIADRLFNVHYINSLWTVQQLRNGIRNYEKEAECLEAERVSIEDLHGGKLYKSVGKYFNPLDIKKVKTIDGVSAYLTNYVTKNETVMYGAAGWNCSLPVSRIFTKKIIPRWVFMETGNEEKNRITTRDKKRTYINQTYIGQYCIINNIYNKSYYRRFLSDLEQINRYILEVEKKEKIGRQLIMKHNVVSNEEYRKLFYINSLN